MWPNTVRLINVPQLISTTYAVCVVVSVLFHSALPSVKPYPPFELEAVTVPEGYLRVTWKQPELPTYEFLFEVRYAMDKPDSLWKVGQLRRNPSMQNTIFSVNLATRRQMINALKPYTVN